MIVFIMCTNYSGSTLLGLILGSHSKCEFMGEFNKRSKFWIKKENYKKAKRKGFCYFHDDCGVFKTVKTYKDALRHYKGKILIDTSKKVQWMDNNSKYGIKVICLLRETEDVFKSHQKRRFVKDSFIKNINRSKMVKLKACFKHKHLTVHFDDILKGDGIRRCCEFIGIEYEPEMLDFWKKNHHGIGNESLINGILDGSVRGIRR